MITCVISGATSGIGLSILNILIKKKISVIVIGRSQKKWNLLKSKNHSLNKVKFIEADLSEIKFVKKIKKKLQKIKCVDLMINNAGLINYKLEINSLNYEKTFFTNFLSTFFLIKILLPKILKSKSPTVINVSSFASRFGKVNLDNLDQKKNYDSWQSYINSKLMVSLLTKFYSYKFFKKIVFLSWSPGYTKSNLGLNSSYIRKFIFYLRQIFGQNPNKAAVDFFHALKKFNNFKYSGSFIFKRKIILDKFFQNKINISKKLYKITNKIIFKHCK